MSDTYEPIYSVEIDNVDNSDAASTVADGTDAAASADVAATVSDDTADAVASPILSAAPSLMASNSDSNTTRWVMSAADYGADEDPISGTLRYWLAEGDIGDTIKFDDSLFSDGVCTIRLKRSLPVRFYSVDVDASSDTENRRLILTPADDFSGDGRMLPTTISDANASYTNIDFCGFYFPNDDASAVQAALFAFRSGRLDFYRCGFYLNSDGLNGIVLLNSSTGSEKPYCYMTGCIIYGNVSPNQIFLNKSANSSYFSLNGCTIACNYCEIADVYDVTRGASVQSNSIIEKMRIKSKTTSMDVRANVYDYDNGDLHVLTSSPWATATAGGQRVSYDFNVITAGGPWGCYFETKGISYLRRLFGDKVHYALASIGTPFTNDADADQVFG